MSLQLPNEIQTMLFASREAGLRIRKSWMSRVMDTECTDGSKEMVTKANETDLQTETDRECEKVVRKVLSEAFPDHLFIGEEEVAENCGEFQVTDAPTFIVDPIDGTTNFVHCAMTCTVLIARMEKKVITHGVILDPIKGEVFFGWRGGGAWLQQLNSEVERIGDCTRLKTSGATELSKAMICTDIGSRRDKEGVEAFLKLQRELLVEQKIRGLRVCGGCGIGLAMVASGRMDAYVELGSPYLWDYAAGSLLIEEAGGKSCEPRNGDEIDFKKRDILGCASKELADNVITAVKSSF